MIKRRIFNEEHELFRASVAKWVDNEVIPHTQDWHEAGIVSRDIWRSAGKNGFLCMYADEKYGGAGIEDFRFDQILIEELSRGSSGFFLPLHNRIVGPYLHRIATPEQRDRYMPGCVSGETILSIAMTEAGTGSDLSGMKTSARDMGDHWLINGSKTYISNGLLSDLCVVCARTDPDSPHAIGLFLVESGMEGYHRGKKLKKMGLQAQDTAELFFEDVKVPKENVLGEPNSGFRTMMTNLAEERLTGSIGFLARAERAFQLTLDYIMERKAFGTPIGCFQNSRFKMAEMRTKLDACQAMVDHCVQDHIEQGLSGEMAAQVKLFSSEVQGEVVDECLQLHGGAGYMDEYEISRLYTDARVSRIYAGTSEIMKEIIGRSLGLDDRRKK